MKKYFYRLLPICLFILAMTDCDDAETVISIGEARNLVAEISTRSVAIGDNVTFTVKVDQQDNQLALEEDINVVLTFADKSMEGKDIPVSDVSEGFAGHLFMKRGEKQGSTEFKVKNDLTKHPISGTITAYVGGYKINATKRPIVVSDKHYTILSLRNNSGNTMEEYGSSILVATVEASAKEDVVVHIDTDEDADKYENLPSELMARTGYKTAEPELIQVKEEKGPSTFTSVSVSFATNSEIHPAYGSELETKVTDTDTGLTPGTELTSEQWVCTDPGQIFVSANNKRAIEKWDEVRTASALLIREDDPHPDEALAAERQTFLNSYEFHPIDALTEGTGLPNQYGNRPPRFTAAQDVANTQEVRAVVNEKYTTMTQDGYLKMWCAYGPEISVTGEVTGTKNFGVSSLYASKFDGVPTGADSWESSNICILPDARMEVRICARGEKHSFNSAIWFQGNIRDVRWSTYGGVDLLGDPATNANPNGAWQTFHWNNISTSSDDKHKPPSGRLVVSDMDEFDIYWMEWRDNNEIALGINGRESIRMRTDGSYTGIANGTTSWNSSTHWSFTDKYSTGGLHLLLTFAGYNEWVLGDAAAEQATKDGSQANDFKHTSYQGSKSNSDTPRIEIDWMCFYKKPAYGYFGSGAPTRNKPVYQ